MASHRQVTCPPNSDTLEGWKGAHRELSAEYWVEVRENEMLRQRQSWLEQRVHELEVKLYGEKP
jgi:hypothetical protein